MKQIVRRLLPPIVADAARNLWNRRPFALPEWEYAPDGWRTGGPQLTGWNVASVLATQQARWPGFVRALQTSAPLGVSPEADPVGAPDYVAHNIYMSYAYVLALAAHQRDRIALLDWGGGIGHYAVISRALLPAVTIDYHCKDLPLLCAGGRQVLPGDHFSVDEADCLQRDYDLVLASGSLHYSEDWQRVAGRLVSVTRGYLYITRLPVVQHAASFVVIQRPHHQGYRTAYPGWFLNQSAFLVYMQSLGVELLREFLIQPQPYVHNAPEQAAYRGFLFRPAHE